jgi:hypothetical protein
MANDFFVPFNYEPTSTTVETTTYSLAAGSYARITATGFNAPLVADGETLLRRYDFYGNDYATTTSTSPVTFFTCPEGVELVGYFGGRGQTTGGVTYTTTMKTRTGSTSLIYDRFGNTTLTTQTSHNSSSYVYSSRNILMLPGDYLEHDTNSALFAAFSMIDFRAVNRPEKTDFWVSGGASGITITGDIFIVEEYTSIA